LSESEKGLATGKASEQAGSRRHRSKAHQPQHSVKLQLLLALFTASFSVAALTAEDKEPAAEVFNRGAFRFRLAIPETFGQPVDGESAYQETDAGKAPYRELTWKHDQDLIAVRSVVVPEKAWQSKTPERMFTDAKALILRDKNVKIIAEHAYSIGKFPAYSFILSITGKKPDFQRIDYILTNPDMNVVMYASPTKEALQGEVCKAFYRSFAIEAKPATK
jgi:hypothetical protein